MTYNMDTFHKVNVKTEYKRLSLRPLLPSVARERMGRTLPDLGVVITEKTSVSQKESD